MNTNAVYLASPYTDADISVMKARCEAVQKAAARLMRIGVTVFSPIAHSHGIADFLPEKLRRDTEFWLRQDLPLLARCNELRVLRLPSWEASCGIQAEIAFAREHGIPVSFLRP